MNTQEMLDMLVAIRESATVDKIFGKPEVMGEKTIIPIAQVSYGLGAGFGEGKEPSGEGEPEARQRTGRGGGGGGGVSVVPKAVLEVTPTRTTLIPIMDMTRVALAGILLSGWIFFTITSTIRSLRKRK